MPGYEARIVDENGHDLPDGEIGSLLIKGDSICSCYWNNHEKTKETITPIKKNWRIIGCFGRVTHVETRPVVSVSVACIYDLLSVYASLAEARNCAY